MRIQPYLQLMKIGEKHSTLSKVTLRAATLLAIFAVITIPSILHGYSEFRILPVTTSHMQPAAEIGDAFITVNKQASHLNVGDIVIMQEEASGNFFARPIMDIVQQDSLIKITTQRDFNLSNKTNAFMVSAQGEVPVTMMRVKWLGYASMYLSSTQGKQVSLSLMVIGNVVALILFLFRKRIRAGVNRAEKVFKDLYSDLLYFHQREVRASETYRDLYEQTYKELELLRKHSSV